jgi:carboxypeptidase C (cathepsin A)
MAASSSQTDVKDQEPKTPAPLVEEAPVVSHHTFSGIDTEVKAGRLPLKNDDGEIQALVFFVSYTKVSDEPNQKRPLMFVFNGGPGSPTIWLHMGALGPMRAPMMKDGTLPPPPYSLEENPETWLSMYDLVFVDPVGTGYSRAKDEKTAETYWSLTGDLESMAEFIRLFTVREKRTDSPLYLCGESYGTTRCAGLAAILTEKGMLLNGVVLISVVLNFQTLEFRKGNDLPFPLFLPTYAATAQRHGRTNLTLEEAVSKARELALGKYWVALAKGTNLSLEDERALAEELSAITGLSADYLCLTGLRPVIYDFCKELLRSERRVVGRLDSRIKGIEDVNRGADQRGETDPSMDILMGPYVSLFQAYVRTTLGYVSDLEYLIFKGIKKPWNWGSARDGYPDTSDHLRKAMSRNPYMKTFVASGLFDLATPFFATEYTLSHMGLDRSLAGGITIKEYEAGHMMYIDVECMSRLAADVAEWQRTTLP